MKLFLMGFLLKKIQMKYIKYEVIFEVFTERHFIKGFQKKYKSAWDFTLKNIIEEFEQIDLLFLKSTAEYITNKIAIKNTRTYYN